MFQNLSHGFTWQYSRQEVDEFVARQVNLGWQYVTTHFGVSPTYGYVVVLTRPIPSDEMYPGVLYR